MVIAGEHLSTPEKKVGDLPMYRQDHKDGGSTFWSCWSLSKEELAAMQEHGSIFIGLINPHSFPVMCVSAPGDVSQTLSGDGSPD